ncbi:MAG TPA: HNH endonuclease, partial [Candidatus Cybelea sp.]
EAFMLEFGLAQEALVPLQEGGYAKKLQLREDNLGRARARASLREDGFWDGGFDDAAGVGYDAPTEREYLPRGGPMGQQQLISDIWDAQAKSYYAWTHDPAVRFAIELLSDFVLGRSFSIIAASDKVQPIIDEFVNRELLPQSQQSVTPWGPGRITNRLHDMATSLWRDGELFLRKFSMGDGRIKVRSLPPETIWEIVTDAEDPLEVFYYVQRYQCLDGDTKIPLLDGTEITIREMAQRNQATGENFDVYSFDLKNGRIVPGNASSAVLSGTKRCVEVELDNGEKVIASYDHPFLTRQGEYVWAERLQPGQSLMPLYRRRGYEMLWQPDSGWNPTHREFAKEMGLDLSARRHVDHINGNPADNRPENLQSMTHGEHTRKTWADIGMTERRQAGIARGIRAFKFTPEHCKKLSEAQKTRWATTSPEERAAAGQRLVESRRETPEKNKEWRLKISRARTKAFEPVAIVNHKVAAVREVGDREVYDLTVDKYENFAVSAGVFVHNTRVILFAPPNLEPAKAKWIERTIARDEMIHVLINAKESDARGRGDPFASLGWAKRLRDYFDAMIQKQFAQAAYQWLIQADGGTEDLQRLAGTAIPSERPRPGSYFMTNKAVDVKAISSNIGGAVSGEGTAYDALLNHVALAFGLNKSYFGVDSHANRATALVATEPTAKHLETRQDLIIAFLTKLIGDVITEAAKFRIVPSGEDLSFKVQLPSIIKADAPTRGTMIRQAEGMAYISKQTAAETFCAEAEIDDYDFDDEQQKIQAELGSEQDPKALILKDMEMVAKGQPLANQAAWAPGDVPNPAYAPPSNGASNGHSNGVVAKPTTPDPHDASPTSGAGAAAIRNELGHGGAGDKSTMASEAAFREYAKKHNLVVIYPD